MIEERVNIKGCGENDVLQQSKHLQLQGAIDRIDVVLSALYALNDRIEPVAECDQVDAPKQQPSLFDVLVNGPAEIHTKIDTALTYIDSINQRLF